MKWLIAGVTLLTSISSAAVANTEHSTTVTSGELRCETPSTELLRLGDAYYDLQTEITHAPRDLKLLDQLYERLQGRWAGSLSDNYCSGVGDSAQLKTRAYLLKRVEADLHHEGALVVKSEKHLIEKKKGSSRVRSLNITPGNRIDFWPGKDVTSLRIENENTVAMTSKYRQRNQVSPHGARLSTFRERQDRLSLDANSLQIETRYFSNGYFTGYEVIHLTRR